jgi:hypothetical protein
MCSTADRSGSVLLCEAGAVDVSGWPELRANATGVTLRLPPASSEIADSPSQVWSLAGGAGSVSIEWEQSDWHEYLDSIGQASTGSVCVDSAGAHVALVRFEWVPQDGPGPATGPGLYVTAVWESHADADLLLIGRVPTMERDTLMAIVRTIRFSGQ